MIAAAERAQLRAIEAELRTLRLGAPPALDTVMPAVRELLGTDNALVYAFEERVEGWRLARWHGAGDVAPLERFVRRLFASNAERSVFYDPGAPEPWMRNRVIDAIAWIDRDVPGTYRASALCRQACKPCGMQDREHMRALVCDGRALLGWFGALVPGRPAPHHRRLLQALVPAVRGRLALERHLDLADTARRALSLALDKIGAPALVIDAGGAVVEANEPARVELAVRRAELAELLADARRGHGPAELTPIVGRGEPTAWLAVLRPGSRDARLEHAVAAATARWRLTPRRRAVLARVVHGEANGQIAAALEISPRAVELHVTALLDLAGVDSRAALVARVLLDA